MLWVTRRGARPGPLGGNLVFCAIGSHLKHHCGLQIYIAALPLPVSASAYPSTLIPISVLALIAINSLCCALGRVSAAGVATERAHLVGEQENDLVATPPWLTMLTPVAGTRPCASHLSQINRRSTRRSSVESEARRRGGRCKISNSIWI